MKIINGRLIIAIESIKINHYLFLSKKIIFDESNTAF
jgi:hypothetical protein